MTSFEIRDEPRRRTAVVHGSLPQSELPAFMGGAIAEAFAAVAAAGLVPGGAPFSRYFTFGPDRIDVETGVMIAELPGGPEKAFEGSGRVQPGELPGGQAAVALHVGPYEGLSDTWHRLMGWVEEQGREPTGSCWEVYMSDPNEEPDPAGWRTELVVPLA